MKVKVFDEEHEKDLESAINAFITDVEVFDIKYEVAIAVSGEDQIYCFSVWNFFIKYNITFFTFFYFI